MTRTLQAGLVVLAGVVLVAGCGKDERGPAKVTAAKTPKEAVVNMVKAIEENNKELFIRSINIPDRELAEAAFEGLFAIADFLKEYERAYGEGAAQKARFRRMPSSVDVAQNVKIRIDGDKVIARLSDRTPPTRLVKVDGEWKVQPPGKGPKPEDREEFLEASRAIVKALNEAKSKIGRKGYDGDKVLIEMVEAIAKVPTPGL